MTDFIFLGSKLTADGDCSHEIKRPLFLWRKGMTNISVLGRLWNLQLGSTAEQSHSQQMGQDWLSSMLSRLSSWHSGRGSLYQCRRHKRCRFHPWAGKNPWSRKWQPTPVFLPGKFHGWRSLANYSPRSGARLID